MNLELEILRVLEAAHPRQLKESVVIAEVQIGTEETSRTTVTRKIRALEGKGQLRIYEGEDVTRIAITTAGLDRVAESQ